jgi:hypothetical protein
VVACARAYFAGAVAAWAPGAAANAVLEVNLTTAKDGLVAGKAILRLSNISVPTLTVYAPQGKK